MIHKIWLKEPEKQQLAQLKKQYPDVLEYIRVEDLPELWQTTQFLQDSFYYNLLYNHHTEKVYETLPPQNKEFLKTYEAQPGRCWQTCYDFCLLAPERFLLCEGYYDGLESCYHWVVYDTYEDWYLDIHFDLLGVGSEGFTEKDRFTIKEYKMSFVLP